VPPRDEHFLSLVVEAPGGLPIASVCWLTGNADRDYQPAGSNEISPHRTPLFDSHLQGEMRVCKKVAHGSTASGNVGGQDAAGGAVALKRAVLPLSLWRNVRGMRSKTYVHLPEERRIVLKDTFRPS
jgi:hypothetical protein